MNIISNEPKQQPTNEIKNFVIFFLIIATAHRHLDFLFTFFNQKKKTIDTKTNFFLFIKISNIQNVEIHLFCGLDL